MRKFLPDLNFFFGKKVPDLPGYEIVEHFMTSWEFFFGLLQQYIEDEGHALVPRSYITKNGYKLGQWVSYQQNSYKKGKLLLSKQARLEQLPGWVWEHSEALWQEGYKCLCEYAEREGHANVPISYVTKDDFNLMFSIINDAARAYRGIIPDDRWKEPYMPAEELRH